MLNLQQQLHPVLPPHPGELMCRGIFQALGGTSALHPGRSKLGAHRARRHARHTTRALRVPLGSHTSPGYLFTPKAHFGATVMPGAWHDR